MGSVLLKSKRMTAFFFDLLCYIAINAVFVMLAIADRTLVLKAAGLFLTDLTVLAALILSFRTVMGFYKSVWRYAHTKTYLSAIVADTVAALTAILLTWAVRGTLTVWYFIVVTSLFTLLTLVSRLAYRLICKHINKAAADLDYLLFRKPININNGIALEYYKDKTVLVTGGGGSIGSEICRQIAACAPRRLVILDIYENNAYEIQQELLREYGASLELSVYIASVRDAERLCAIFNECRPDVVFHAAAHKHVPLMQSNPSEAIKNNVLGTYNAANAAEQCGAQKFIMISTDKAVNPTNIMGASKRMCEMIVQCRSDSNTSFASVRFGNVLGSNGSVVPLFRRQIENGGPVTITDKRIVRYFMTIPEAGQLVIQAGAMAKQGQLFVLDMGEPVKIYDLAVNMIKLYGLIPEKDIKIEEIGLRSGEKLFEELLINNENVEKTDNDMIYVETDTPYTREQVDEKIDILVRAMESPDEKDIAAAMKIVVPTFSEPDEINSGAEAAKKR